VATSSCPARAPRNPAGARSRRLVPT